MSLLHVYECVREKETTCAHVWVRERLNEASGEEFLKWVLWETSSAD